jgi:hypothetical protein
MDQSRVQLVESTAYRFIEVYSAFGDFPTLGNMTLDVSGLYLFAASSTSDEIRARFMHNSQFAGNFRGIGKLCFQDYPTCAQPSTTPKRQKPAPVKGTGS